MPLSTAVIPPAKSVRKGSPKPFRLVLLNSTDLVLHLYSQGRFINENGKMEEDVKPKDEDGVDGRGVCGWDGLLGDLGAVGASLTFGVVRGE